MTPRSGWVGDVAKGRCQFLAEQTLWRQQLSSEGQLGGMAWLGSQHVSACLLYTSAPRASHEVLDECVVINLTVKVRPRLWAKLPCRGL